MRMRLVGETICITTVYSSNPSTVLLELEEQTVVREKISRPDSSANTSQQGKQQVFPLDVSVIAEAFPEVRAWPVVRIVTLTPNWRGM